MGDTYITQIRPVKCGVVFIVKSDSTLHLSLKVSNVSFMDGSYVMLKLCQLVR